MRKDNKKINKSQFFKGIALSVVLTASLIITQPIYTVNTFAAAVEDCDLDGYDDHTGNPVPWIGFDSTKGEEIPSGWDGHTVYKSKKAFEDSLKADEEDKSDSSSNSSSSGSSSGSSASSSSSSSKSSSNKSSSSKSSSSSAKSNSSKSNSSKSNSSKSSSSKGSSSSTSSDSADSSQASSVEETTVAGNVEETTAADDANKEETKKKKEDKTEESTEIATEITEPADVQTVLNTKGDIEVSEADGSVIHAGSDLIITGTGFAGNVAEITIEIHSDNAINLASINTAEDGSFESQVYIPEDLSEGEHEIVLLYQGQEITSQSIKVGPAVADTFLKALTVGFSSENEGLVPGLLILAGLFVAGVITVLVGGFFRKFRS